MIRNTLVGLLLMMAGGYVHQLLVHNGVLQPGLVVRLEESLDVRK